MAISKKAISFGLVYIPVALNTIIYNNDTAFNQLHKKCGSRIKYEKICPYCNVEVEQKDIIKDYEYSEDKYVTFTDKDMEKIKLSDEEPIEIISFVDLDEIDPIYFEKSYYLTTKNNKAFNLLKTVLKKENKVALAKTVIGTKFYYVIIRCNKNYLILNTLYFNEEINIDRSDDTKEEYSQQEINMATKLVRAMTGKFEPEKYKDEYQSKIRKAIEQKVSGKQITKSKENPKKGIADLMKALKQSLKDIEK